VSAMRPGRSEPTEKSISYYKGIWPSNFLALWQISCPPRLNGLALAVPQVWVPLALARPALALASFLRAEAGISAVPPGGPYRRAARLFRRRQRIVFARAPQTRPLR
jgi:hypothetical protein